MNGSGRRGGCFGVLPIFFLIGLLASCGGGGSPTPPPTPPPSSQPIALTMDAASWRFQYSPGMPNSPSPDAEGWSFNFPDVNGVHYVGQTTSGKLGTVRAQFTVSRSNPSAQLVEVEPCDGTHAAVRLMFQRFGDTLAAGTAQAPTPYADYRWWGVEAWDLRQTEPGALQFSADPNRWTNVFGQNGADRVDQWAAAANAVQGIFFTFGGCFAGHGVYKTGEGSVTFKANSVTAQ